MAILRGTRRQVPVGAGAGAREANDQQGLGPWDCRKGSGPLIQSERAALPSSGTASDHKVQEGPLCCPQPVRCLPCAGHIAWFYCSPAPHTRILASDEFQLQS